MKRLILLASVLIGLTGCGSDDEPKENTQNPVKYSVVGVWESDNYFLSFSEDGYCAAYIAEDYIDSGSYTQNGNIIECNNPYFNTTAKYTITKRTNVQLDVDVVYTDRRGKERNTSISFTKTDKTPVIKDNPLVGKSVSSLSYGFGYVSLSFNTHNSGIKSCTKIAEKYPMNFVYIYYDKKIYTQVFENPNAPTIGGWGGYDVIRKNYITVLANGGLQWGA